jgi:hypothetical protein
VKINAPVLSVNYDFREFPAVISTHVLKNEAATGNKSVLTANTLTQVLRISPATISLPLALMSTSSIANTARKTAEPFSLVPFTVQRRLYDLVQKAITLRERLGLTGQTHTDFAEIGAIAALLESDPVYPAPYSIGARVIRARDLDEVQAELKALESRSAQEPSALLMTIVGQLLTDSKRFAVVPVPDIAQNADWQNVLRFAGRHRVPILFIVPGRIAGHKDSSADLRTVYAEYGVPVMIVDANDPIAAYRVATEAAHNARVGRGATVLQAAYVETPNRIVNSQHPLEHLEEYMRKRGSWVEGQAAK